MTRRSWTAIGIVTVALAGPPGPQFKVVAKNSLGEMTLATPAVSRGSLIIRTASTLYRLMKTRL
jgi:threonine/homoserine/homoserine lactone efflux protein